MRYLTLASLFAIILFSNCSESERTKQYNVIVEMENRLINDTTMVLNKNAALDISRKYDQFATDFPTDSLAPYCLFEAGRMTMNLNMGSKAVGYFNRIVNNYPEYEKIPEAIFLKAYTYENVLGDYAKAKENYSTFANSYPDHALYNDAVISISQMGIPLEKIIEKFEEDNKKE